MKFGQPTMENVISLHQKGNKPHIIAGVLEMPLYRVKAIIAANRRDAGRIKRVSEMKKRGMTDSDIARDEGVSKQYISRLTGTRRLRSQDLSSHVINMDQGLWLKLMKQAEEFGLIVEDGVHAGRGSVRKLLEQVALGNLTILKDRMIE